MNRTDLLSIKDFAEFTGIKQSVLRYYDEIGLFNPTLRGKNGYRYYSCQQIITVNLINVLVSLDIPRKKIIEFEQSRTPKSILKLFANQETILNEQLRQISNSYSIIHTFRDLIEEGLSVDINAIQVCTAKRTPITLGPANHFLEEEQFYHTFIKYCDYAKKCGVNLSYPIGGYYESFDSFTQSPSQPNNFFSLNPLGNTEKPADNYLVGYTQGYYGEMGDIAERLYDYAKTHNLNLTGSVYAIYLQDEICLSNTNQYLAQISVRIKS
jgi:Predicted transcriptional regulators